MQLKKYSYNMDKDDRRPIMIKLYMSSSCFYILRKYQNLRDCFKKDMDEFSYDIQLYTDSRKVISDFSEEYSKMKQSYAAVKEHRFSLWDTHEFYYIVDPR